MAEQGQIDALIAQAKEGDEQALAQIFEAYRERLRRMVNLRINSKVRTRVGVSDVLQEAYVDLASQLKNYTKDPKLPFFIWVRKLTGQRLSKIHRKHFGAAKRNAAMEVSLHRGRMPQATSFALASKLVGNFTAADKKMMRAERQLKLQEVLNDLEEDDREVLAMRHFEHLSNSEVATILEITDAAARMRHIRALRKLKLSLNDSPDLFSGVVNLENGGPITMSDVKDRDDLLGELADDFVQRSHRGEEPSVEEYCETHPELATDIRELFPMMVVMEQANVDSRDDADKVDEKLPDQIGDYRIIGKIGQGGMGIVYEAEQISLNRRVALKVLPGQIAQSGGARVRFEREARAAAKLHHTNIVPVFEVGHDENYFFYAMQLIRGHSLDQVIGELNRMASGSEGSSKLQILSQPSWNTGSSSGNSLSPKSTSPGSGSDLSNRGSRIQFFRAVAKIGFQVADALAFAHAAPRNVIHRDIKPSNLLLDEEGNVWVADFGLAKTDDEGLTQTGDFLGTLRYMSPERFSGQCDARADVYALGLTLYELILQRPAFETSDRLSMINKIQNEEPPRLRSIDKSVPIDLGNDHYQGNRQRTKNSLSNRPLTCRRLAAVY